MIRRFISPDFNKNTADWALLILRVGISLLMLRYGFTKFNKILTSDFGFADPIGLGEKTSLFLAVFAEFFCSILLILGLFTRAALVPLITTMLIAFFIIHKNDDFNMREHPLVFLLPYITIWLMGAGVFRSIKSFLNKKIELN
ncbi:MAG: DoxX family protein [Saprospiraceae bacterium]|nr:DoxX family protein [Saprospiraceae bacterium]